MGNYERAGEKTPLFVIKEDPEISSSGLCRSAGVLPWLLRIIAAIGIALLIYTITSVIKGIDQGGFDYDLAQSLIYHAETAYYCRSSPTCACLTCEHKPILSNDTIVIKDIKLDLWGYVTHDQQLQAVVIAFAGTGGTSTQNWAHNIDVLLIDIDACSGCQIHHGFHTNYAAIQSQVQDAVDIFSITYPTAPIIVTGHSMGGALTTLCVMDLLLHQQKKVAAAYTYGSPRVGNPQFAKAFAGWTKDSPFFRLTHGGDPIVSAPWTSFGFQHTPREVYYVNAPNRYRVCNDASGENEDPKCAASYDDRKLSTVDKNAKHLNYMSQQMGNDDPSVRRLVTKEGKEEGDKYPFSFPLQI